MHSKSKLRLSQFWEPGQPWKIIQHVDASWIPFLQEALEILQLSGFAMFHQGAFSSTSILPTGLSSASMSIQHTGLLGLGSPEAPLGQGDVIFARCIDLMLKDGCVQNRGYPNSWQIE